VTRLLASAARGTGRRAAGFTLVEMIAVMVIVGILATVAAPRFFATDVFAASGYAADLRAALRHAQALSLASGCATGVVVDADGYRLQRWLGGSDCNDLTGKGVTVGRPGGDLYAVQAPRGVTATATELTFDSLGRPRDVNGALITVQVALAIGDHRITVQPQTGLIE